MKHATVAALLVALGFSTFAQVTKESKLPRLEDFPEAERGTGSPPKVVLDRPAVRMFRTQFRLAALQPPNFAGHYRIAIWGCGTQCLEGGMVDLATGKIVALPSPRSLRGKGLEYWRLCDSAFQPSGIENSVDSRLLVIRCADISVKNGGAHLRTSYFVFENDSFKKIREVKGERVF